MSLFKHNCEVNGHRFEPRYDTEKTAASFPAGLSSAGRDVALALCERCDTKSTYVHDICVRCGAIIKRAAP